MRLRCSVHHLGACMASMPAGGAQHTLMTAHPARIAQGYPSIGDLHSTVPVPEDKWYEYAGERSGRFQVWPQTGFLPLCHESQNALSVAEKRCWHMLCPTGLLKMDNNALAEYESCAAELMWHSQVHV